MIIDLIDILQETEKVEFIANINSSLQKLSKILGSQNYVAGDKVRFLYWYLGNDFH